MPENNAPSPRAPAFEVDSLVEMTDFACDPAVCGKSLVPRVAASAPTLTAFSSNSTADPGSYTRAIVQNKPVPTSGENNRLSEPEWLHSRAVNQLRQLSRLSDLAYCETQKTESRQQVNGDRVTATHFNTKCDATASPQPFVEVKEITVVSPDVPEKHVISSATGRSGGEAFIPEVKRKTAPDPDGGGNIFSSMLNPVMNAMYDAGQFISRNDPLKFPGADAAPLHNDKSVNKFLLHRGLIKTRNPEGVPLIKTLNGVAEYLALNPRGLPHLASKLPGGKTESDTGEIILMSEESARIVLYRWLSNQVLGMNADHWLAEKMAGHALKKESTVGELEQLLAADAVLPHNQRHYPEGALKKLWGEFVRDTFPLFAVEGARNLLLHDKQWGLIHAGSRVLKDAGTPDADIDVESATYVGNMFLALLQENALPANVNGNQLFRLQALLEYARKHPEELPRDGAWEWEYITGRADSELLEAYGHHQNNNVVARFNHAMSHWKTRRQVIEQQIKYYEAVNPGKKQYSVNQYMNEYFSGTSRVRDNNPPPILPVEKIYKSSTAHVANSFAELDRLLVIAALAGFDDAETAFINGAEIKRVSARITMPRPFVNGQARGFDQWAEARKDAELLSNVDLLSARRGNEERIYALKGENDNYSLYRVDRNKDSYFLRGLMSCYRDNNHPESKLDIFPLNTIKSAAEGLASLVDSLVRTHKENFHQGLYDKGYEKTGAQKMLDFMYSLIPFYDCTRSIQAGDAAGTSISCTLDVIAFIPALGEIASLATRFAASAVKASLRAAGRIALNVATRDALQNGLFRQTIRSVGSEFLRGIYVPTKYELGSLGMAVVRGFDPGLETIVDAKRLTKALLYRLLKQIKKMPGGLEKLVTRLGADADVIAPLGKNTAFQGDISVNIKGAGKELGIENRIIETLSDDVYFDHHITNKLNGAINKDTLSLINPNQHGIYTVTSKQSVESFHAIKIDDKFYRYIPDNKMDVSLSGVIKTENADIRVSRFDKRYFIVNEKNKLLVDYSPCRLTRSPGALCLHLSDGLTNKLHASKKNGIPANDIQGLKPSATQPGLYESANGKLYLQHDDVYFKLVERGKKVDSGFMVTGKKRFGSKQITPVSFSREKGRSYINLPEENMMESAGISRKEAISHLEMHTDFTPVDIERAWSESMHGPFDLDKRFAAKRWVTNKEPIIVYRQDNRSLDEIAAAGGFYPRKEKLGSIEDHMIGSRDQYSYVSTSIKRLKSGSYGKYEYAIYLEPHQGIDTAATLGVSHGIHSKSVEFAIPGIITPEQIKGWRMCS
ncbi:scabin-related ADP-ribosyltransferase [Erwinia mallotivora]|uniref:scabin-related ADP-ribosyltransferase n=1 Tax=Erwinia mallotivora TaxID=69222 RepID=UPI0021BF29DB|nr:hypothetical protein [Erwinia mallotivora]